LAQVAGRLAGVSGETVLGTNLKSVKQLEGYGQHVNKETAEALKRSTVMVVSQYSDPNTGKTYEWQEDCSGTKISFGGANYVLSAGHCFHYAGGSKGGGDYPDAANILPNSYNNYGVVLPGSDDTIKTPFSNVFQANAVSIDLGGRDFALMRIDSQPGDAFDQLPSVDANMMINALPTQGAEVAMFGFPAAAKNEMVYGRGIYLGTIQQYPGSNISLDLVGVENARSSTLDACNYGSSGSSGVLSTGRILGPMHYRYNLNYDKGTSLDQGDKSRDDPTFELKTVLSYEEKLGVNMRSGNFNTICAYNSADSTMMPMLVHGLETPFVAAPIDEQFGPMK
jgi:hypothetical protein